MEKIYEIDKLLKPIQLYEQESDDFEAKDVDAKNNEEQKVDEKKSEENNKKSDEVDDKKEKEEPSEEKKDETSEKPKEINEDVAKKQRDAINKVNSDLTNCAVELDNIYKNNNLKKYGVGVENAYKGMGRFIWPAVGIGVACAVAFCCIKGWIPIKKVLSKMPVIGKLFQGDRMAINTVQNTLLMTGTNKAAQAINNVKLPGKGNNQDQVVGNATVVDNNAQDSTQDFDAIRQRIANQTASNEDMEYAYKQWKAGNYPTVGPATKAYFEALDQGKSHDEAQQAADAANPKKQNNVSPATETTSANVAPSEQPSANNDVEKSNTTDEPQADNNKPAEPSAETPSNGTETQGTDGKTVDANQKTEVDTNVQDNANVNTVSETPVNTTSGVVSPDTASNESTVNQNNSGESINDVAKSTADVANQGGPNGSIKASDGRTIAFGKYARQQLGNTQVQVGQPDTLIPGAKVGDYISGTDGNGKASYIVVAPGKYGTIDRTGKINTIDDVSTIQYFMNKGYKFVPDKTGATITKTTNVNGAEITTTGV